MAPTAPFWEQLFAPGDANRITRRPMRLLRRAGHPFLLLPASPRGAVATLNLYSPQTARARLAKALFQQALRLPFLKLGEPVQLTLSHDSPFVDFIRKTAGLTSSAIPNFGVLAGNPASVGQRYMLLVLDPEDRPKAVVKAGLTPEARRLVDNERAFLESCPRVAGVPRLLGGLGLPTLSAMATEFVPGRSPKPGERQEKLWELLNAWLNTGEKIAIQKLGPWQQLQASSAREALAAPGLSRLAQQHVRTIQHGDFAPWNVRVSPTGTWLALDWERGTLSGIPGWDFFHYRLQPAILVHNLRIAELVAASQSCLGEPEFRAYAREAGVDGVRRELLLSYLWYMSEVIRPSEGLDQTRQLLAALSE